MSWFDRAKTALKEAQKQIDKALDIREEEEIIKTSKPIEEKQTTTVTTTTTTASRTAPNTPIQDAQVENKKRLATSSWGSFSGSFFENPNANEMVTTTAPKATATVTQPLKRHSMTSNSDSVELLSPSEIATPPEVNISGSVELITTASEITTPEELSSAAACGTDSIVIIGSNDEEEDSLSYNTVMDETLTAQTITSTTTATATATAIPANLATSFDDSRDLSSCGSLTPRASIAQGNKKLHLSRDDASDSTQSFEDVQMLNSTDTVLDSNRDSMIDDKFDLNQMIMTSTASYLSPHNSNDEIDTNTTTTSSDIEIISNPNGDSSSTHSATRICPSKMKKLVGVSSVTQFGVAHASKKGHCREPSEISVLSEDSQTEIDKLSHRINELTEQLEARESQLLQCERQNSAIQERNNELQSMVDAMRTNTANLDSSSEDYTQRLSALEKKFQASIRERDALRIQIQALKDDLRTKVPKEQLDQMTVERDAMISELRLEGEKLSKEVLQQSNIIKKLRAKEKTSDATLKRNTAQIEELAAETDRLKKSLNAKEDMERTHIEAVHKLSSEKRKLEEENSQQRSKFEDLQMKLETMQASFDAVKEELQQRTLAHLDLSRKAVDVQETTKALETLKSENESLSLQLSELREKLRFSEQSLTRREHQLREENKQLLSRLEEAELRAENSTQEISQTTIPLMRQLESLQNTLSQRSANWNKEEKLLLEKLETSQSRLKSLEHVEATYREKMDILQSRCLELEEKLSNALMKNEQAAITLHQTQMDSAIKETNLNKKINELNVALQESKCKLEALEAQNKTLEDRLMHSNSQASVIGSVKETTHSSTDDLLQHKISIATTHQHVGNRAHLLQQQQQQSHHSPPTSVGKNSLEEAMGSCSFDWQADDSDCVSNSGGRSALTLMSGLNFMGHNTSTLEHLQSLLKQRDGELHHIQWEMSRLQSERVVLNEEITNLTIELENLKEKLQVNESLETNFKDLQHRYDELLQMYGEKVERTEELELDLYESREAYKKQIEELLAHHSHQST